MGKQQVNTGRGSQTVNTNNVWDRIVALENNGVPNLSGELNGVKSQLAEIATQLSSFPVQVPETDDTARLRRAIDKAMSSNRVLDLSFQTLSISDKIVIPQYLKLIGNKATFNFNAPSKTAFEISTGDNLLMGFTLDGNSNTKHGIVITTNAVNVVMDGLEIKNLNGDTSTGAYGIQIQNGCSNIHINRSYIHDLTAPENAVIGDSYGASRAILVGEVTRVTISSNKFARIGGFEDGDAIHVSSNVDATLGFTVSMVVIEKNEFYDVKKRAIKLQASGVIVLDNYIESNYVDAVNCPYSGISSFGSRNIIRNNKIKLLRGNYGIELNGNNSIDIIGNIIEVDSANAYPSGSSGSMQNGIFLVGGVSNVRIYDNTINAAYYGVYSATAVTDIKIRQNTFMVGIDYPINLASPTLLDIHDNTFRGDATNPYQAITLNSPSSFKVDANTFERCGMAVRLFGVVNKGKIFNNFIVQSDTDRYRTTDVTSGIDTVEIKDEQNHGNATISAGTTSVTVTHGFGAYPSDILVTPRGNIGNWWVSSVNTTQFTINCSVAPAGAVIVGWRVDR